MAMLRTLLCLLVGAVSILPSAVVTAQATTGTVRIMALGDSITGSPVSPQSQSLQSFITKQNKTSPIAFLDSLFRFLQRIVTRIFPDYRE